MLEQYIALNSKVPQLKFNLEIRFLFQEMSVCLLSCCSWGGKNTIQTQMTVFLLLSKHNRKLVSVYLVEAQYTSIELSYYQLLTFVKDYFLRPDILKAIVSVASHLYLLILKPNFSCTSTVTSGIRQILLTYLTSLKATAQEQK